MPVSIKDSRNSNGSLIFLIDNILLLCPKHGSKFPNNFKETYFYAAYYLIGSWDPLGVAVNFTSWVPIWSNVFLQIRYGQRLSNRTSAAYSRTVPCGRSWHAVSPAALLWNPYLHRWQVSTYSDWAFTIVTSQVPDRRDLSLRYLKRGDVADGDAKHTEERLGKSLVVTHSSSEVEWRGNRPYLWNLSICSRCIPKVVDPCSLQLCEQACEVRDQRIWCTCHSGFQFQLDSYRRKTQPYCIGKLTNSGLRPLLLFSSLKQQKWLVPLVNCDLFIASYL